MEKIIRFFEQDDKWYADVPNHSLEDNEMVMGADIALDLISEGHDEVFLVLSDTEDSNALLHFHIKEHDENLEEIENSFLKEEDIEKLKRLTDRW